MLGLVDEFLAYLKTFFMIFQGNEAAVLTINKHFIEWSFVFHILFVFYVSLLFILLVTLMTSVVNFLYSSVTINVGRYVSGSRFLFFKISIHLRDSLNLFQMVPFL